LLYWFEILTRCLSKYYINLSTQFGTLSSFFRDILKVEHTITRRFFYVFVQSKLIFQNKFWKYTATLGTYPIVTEKFQKSYEIIFISVVLIWKIDKHWSYLWFICRKKFVFKTFLLFKIWNLNLLYKTKFPISIDSFRKNPTKSFRMRTIKVLLKRCYYKEITHYCAVDT